MKKVMIYFGSSTGTTEDVANRIAKELNVDDNHVKNVTDINNADIDDAEVLLLGSSTWGDGELQDDWYDGIKTLKSTNLQHKIVALFGCGDSQSYPDTFCGAIGELYNELKDSGAHFIGTVATEGYDYSDSISVVDGSFVGLALDETNEDYKTDARIAKWIDEIKSSIE